MFSFFRRKRPQQPVSEWASFFNQAEYNQFIDIIEDYFKGKQAVPDFSTGVVIASKDRGEKRTLGLINIAQQCKQSRPREWKQLIRNHFDSIHEIDRLSAEFDKRVHDLAYVKHYLGVRLYHKESIADRDDTTITRPVTEDIDAMLVFDFPHYVKNVMPEQSILWNELEDELFEIAKSNMQAKYKNDVSVQQLGAVEVSLVSADHFFVPNVVFELEKRPGLTGSFGSLVAIPHRHAVLVYPIEHLQVIEATNQLIPLVRYMHDQGPGSISDQLYWYYNGHFERLPYAITDKELQLIPPDNFVEMLNLLTNE